MPLYLQILIAIVLAALIGAVLPETAAIGPLSFASLFAFVGELFLNALKMIVVPLVVASIICGVSGLGSGGELSRLGLRTIGFYLLSSLAAILLGLVLVNWLQPGIIDGEPAGARLNLTPAAELDSTLAKVEGRDVSDIADVFLRMLPTNVVAAAAEGELLGLIVFAILFGFLMSRLQGRPAEVLQSFWQGVFEVMMAMTLLIMRFAPLGVFALVAATVLATGWNAVRPLAVFFVAVSLGLILHVSVTMALVLRFVVGVNPRSHFRVMLPALLTAFSTASSSATLPLTIKCITEGAGISNRTASFVLPLGATVNMDGTALYECMAAIFIAQAYGLDLSFAQQFLIVITALLTSIGVAGIPAASLVAISVILTAIGLPLEGLGLLLVTDRVLDMMRTAVNVFSDSCGAAYVAVSEGETDLYPRSETVRQSPETF